MSDSLGTYSFLPWLRLGVANNIKEVDGDATVKLRATIKIELALSGQPTEGEVELTDKVSRNVALYGPGDIVGIDKKAIVKVEPNNWITNFEPNYLPYIEFYEEDFPWRYSPVAPDLSKHRLRPWLTLVVMKEDEFKDSTVVASRPLPAIEITAPPDTIFPPAEQLWAWAHVHINKDLIKQEAVFVSTDMDATRTRVENLLRKNPDEAYSRIICPRRLEPNVGYHAFLLPSFESGRLAGLGLDPGLDNPEFFASLSSWAEYSNRPVSSQHAYYHRWYFKTGTVGDFEYLVRLLKPRPADPRLGRRDMDTQNPGSNITAVDDPALNGLLRLGGALKVPDEVLNVAEEAEALEYEEWDQPYPHGFQNSLARFINLPDDYAEQGAPDPIVSAPLYGRWHALTERLLFETDDSDAAQNDNWVHELNLDPRWRVPAGFGTKVIQDKQEEYMDAAWEQVGDIIEANRRIRRAQLAKEVSFIWYNKQLKPLKTLSTQRSLIMMAPLQRRVIANGLTVRSTLTRSAIPRAAFSSGVRRIIRPRDQIAAVLGFDNPKGPEQLIEKINTGEISAAPPRVTPDDLPVVDEISEKLSPDGLPKAVIDWSRQYPWVKWLLLLFIVALFFTAIAWPISLMLIAVTGVLVRWLFLQEQQAEVADAALPQGSAPEVVDQLPNFPDFAIRDPDPDAAEPVPGLGSEEDSPEAKRFKLALKDTYQLITLSENLGKLPVRNPVNLVQIADISFTAINPQTTVPAYTIASLNFPAYLLTFNGEIFREAMAYPQFDIPMYKELLAISAEHFLPNIDKIPQNTITLLETNQRFIESYMVGLNHEFARELLWREFPTDQRGSYFRQFWDASGVLNKEGLTQEDFIEKLRDIPPLHRWSVFSKLGDHDHREKAGDNEEEISVVIRGDLLKKYPTAVIYAQKARWQLDDDDQIDPSQERIFDTDGPEENWLRTPLYEAKVDPDITFIGFDLTAKEVKGGTGRLNSTDPGWFIVIKERPGEPRFGLDIERDGQLNVWNDLAWPDVFGNQDKGFLQIKSGGVNLVLTEPDPENSELQEKLEQYQDDQFFSWNPNTNAAELAYILFQMPVLVGVHGSEMLPN
ncbi:hypothetical protein MNBD_GAMMA12-3968 [hydrothermal vent metagenome]|uniref:Uncharacterized protein n=1 Tax=hydrothermal vent metagenome TaxID=652676 RepID=A0A3B0YLU5_9ZZZZ